MRITRFLKSRGFITYIIIGILIFIVPFYYGLTNAVSVFLENKTVFSDYVDQIKQVYINNDKDIAMCVKGNTSGQYEIEYWIFISYSQYEYNDEKFHHGRSTDLSGIDHSLIEYLSCDDVDITDRGYVNIEIAIEYIDKLPKKKDPASSEMFDVDQIEVSNKAFIVEQNMNRSQLALVRQIDGKKIGTLFMMSNVHYPKKLNTFWYLLYFPAFILDILLWPLYLLLFLYSSFITSPSR
jgi:hypothetical protein